MADCWHIYTSVPLRIIGDISLIVKGNDRGKSPMAFSQLTEQACRNQRKIRASGFFMFRKMYQFGY